MTVDLQNRASGTIWTYGAGSEQPLPGPIAGDQLPLVACTELLVHLEIRNNL